MILTGKVSCVSEVLKSLVTLGRNETPIIPCSSGGRIILLLKVLLRMFPVSFGMRGVVHVIFLCRYILAGDGLQAV